ncbi:hypothetical protein [Thalassotalea agarivorans]|uniref:Uncharacterized protein n=1 Tax=Thalassotalea agarivorans TaxID=349064 RepID=A0A1I0E6C1_THASX|nr:hypothetical protein [Thalassotalea agarivorans]SET40714.1 hypothetical protein SAMN05660429_01747 [Thalassotalea agarivorans]
MNKNTLPLFVGAIVAIIVILVLNDFTIVDRCLEQGGSFDYEQGHCLLANGEIYVWDKTPYLVAFNFIVAIVLAFITSRLLKRFITSFRA